MPRRIRTRRQEHSEVQTNRLQPSLSVTVVPPSQTSEGGTVSTYLLHEPMPLYQEERLVVLPQQQQQQQQDNQLQFSSALSFAVPLSPPAAELSVQNLTPFPESLVWSYTFYLGVVLMLWILYLLLPRGFRKRYLGAHRKRYACRPNTQLPSSGYWLPANKSMSDAGASSLVHHHHHRPVPSYSDTAAGRPIGMPPQSSSGSTVSSLQGDRFVNDVSFVPQSGSSHPHSVSPLSSIHRGPPSPDHPALTKVPRNSIIAETMARLQGRGIRLVAHGVHSDAKRVWIKLDDETKSVTWQTEFPRRVPNQSGQVSIVLMRGSVHRIALTNVLYIDVGKKTTALKQLDDVKVPDPTCFSLLTQNGSLDLQASSKLERDALVSCFSMILDDVHAHANWRELYEASPDPSLANSSVASRPTPASAASRLPTTTINATTNTPTTARSTDRNTYPNPSDFLVEV